MMMSRAGLPIATLLVLAVSLACSRSAPIPPSPTPLPLIDMNVVELNKEVRPEDFFGDHVVSIGSDGELYLANITTGEMRQVTDTGYPKSSAVISADYVAWVETRRVVEFPGNASATPRFSNDLFVLDLRTGEDRRITEEPATRYGLRMSGSRLVWQDNRNELGEHYTHFDIYSYDLANELEIPVAIAPGAQVSPAVQGDVVVWADNRNSHVMGTTIAGCSNCPGNRFDIYSYDFTTGRERPLVESGHYNISPSIHGKLVAWQKFRDDGGSDIQTLDIGTGQQQMIAQAGRTQSGPLLSDEFLIWTVRNDCDVIGGLPGDLQTGVFALDLKTSEVRQLSNYVEPLALIHEDVALVHEGCFGTSRVYTISLGLAALDRNGDKRKGLPLLGGVQTG